MSSIPMQEPAVKRVFKCTYENCSYFFSNGKKAAFIGGKYITDIPSEIAELEWEVANNHPNIKIDENEYSVDITNPIEEIKRKAVEEYKASMEIATKAAVDPKRDLGTSEKSDKLQGITSSSSISKAAAGSSSTV